MSRKNYINAATDFLDAYANTNYLRPLNGEMLDLFYVNRTNSELRALLGELTAGVKSKPASNTKFLFVGHTGCGKSTELSKLVNIIETGSDGKRRYAVLQKKLLPIQYSISEVVGLYNIEFVDLALSIILGIYKKMERLGQNMDDTPARRVYDWLYQGESAFGDEVEANGNNLELGSLIRLIDVRLKSEGAVRDEIRARIRRYIPELIGLINQTIDNVAAVTQKSLLLIIDDLDKIQPLDAALNVFREHVKSLTSFNCFVIYTAPISLLYDTHSKHVGQFLETHYMPMFKVRFKDGTPEPPTSPDVTTLREIVFRRVHPDLFEDGVVETAIEMTGGILRELIRIIRGCCVYCHEYEIGKISRQIIHMQKGKLKSEYYRMLEHGDYRQLKQVSRTKSRADVDMRHLESLCVLYYPNGKGWFDVHPVVSELLTEWEETENGA